MVCRNRFGANNHEEYLILPGIHKKKTMILGAGVSGVGAYRLLARYGHKCWLVDKDLSKKNELGLKASHEQFFLTQSEAISKLEDHRFVDEIILSPGIALSHPIVALAKKRSIEVISEIELGYRHLKCPVVAVTGTNGKTTVVEILRLALNLSQKKAFVGGNIGDSLCEYLAKNDSVALDLVLLEVSSFQLETIEHFHPHIVVLLNISPNHQERYETLEQYAQAKFNIGKNLSPNDWLIYYQGNDFIDAWADQLNCRKIACHYQKSIEKIRGLFSFERCQATGEHNYYNFCMAYEVCKQINISDEIFQMVIDSFEGVDYRQQKILANVNFTLINDAKSTNLDATVAAVEASIKQSKEIMLILGGQMRSVQAFDCRQLDRFKQNIVKIFLIGESSDVLASDLTQTFNCEKIYHLDKLVEKIPKDFCGTILFSPGFPSFDQYSSYVKRGEHFNKLFRAEACK